MDLSKGELHMDLGVVVGLLGLACSGVAAWVQLSSRLTRVETNVEHSNRQFDQILNRLESIETKLDHKQDR
jgi:hypothetical protein